MSDRIAIIGLGYVGLPVALAFARKFPNTIGFDINLQKINDLKRGVDTTGEISTEELTQTSLTMTAHPQDLKEANFFVVAVPTPIDENKNPDLTPLVKASKTVGKVLQKGSIVVYESTVYPGVTEEICGAILAKESGLQQGIDFKLAYSPERINPGDKHHTLEKIVKVVSGEDPETLERVARVYETIIEVGVHRASSIKVAEMAKVIENTQRDINIALMNEIALICDRLNIRTADVLAAAKTKWNFLPFTPGMVGGHCIGVDPYYLTTKAESLGYNPEVILAGRRINDLMGGYLGQKLVKLLVKANLPIRSAKVGILGLTFKENVADIRNSRVPDLIQELQQFGIKPLIHDPLADPKLAQEEYNLILDTLDKFSNLDALILAVPHSFYFEDFEQKFMTYLNPQGVLMDVKSVLNPDKISVKITYWSL